MANVVNLFDKTTNLLKTQKSLLSHGETLYEAGWRVIPTNAKRQAGVCKHRSKRIGLSTHLMSNFTDESAWNTATHEVAHAIVGVGHGHDAVWKRAHLMLGGTAERLYNDNAFISAEHTRAHTAPYIGTCPNGHTSHRFRKPKNPTSCAKCSNRYDERYLFTWKHRS